MLWRAGNLRKEPRLNDQQRTVIRMLEHLNDRSRATTMGADAQTLIGNDHFPIARVINTVTLSIQVGDPHHSLIRGDPRIRKQTIGAVKIATEHAETERVGAGVGVEERLLLDRIALERADVAVRHVELATSIESDATDAGAPIANQAAVPAGIASDRVVGLRLAELALAHVLFQCLSQCQFATIAHPSHDPALPRPRYTASTQASQNGSAPPLCFAKRSRWGRPFRAAKQSSERDASSQPSRRSDPFEPTVSPRPPDRVTLRGTDPTVAPAGTRRTGTASAESQRDKSPSRARR